MTSLTHQPPAAAEPRSWLTRLGPPEAWTALSIVVMWLAVLFDAVFGPDIVSTTTTTTSHVPSAIIVAFFAWLGTWVVARNGFRQRS
jgi:hypothetical protein